MASQKSPTKAGNGHIRPFRIAGAGEIRISARIQDSDHIAEEAEELSDVPLNEVSVAMSQNMTIKEPSASKTKLSHQSLKKADPKNPMAKSKITGVAGGIRAQTISMTATTKKGGSSSRGKAPARSVSPKKQSLPQPKQAVSPRKAISTVPKASVGIPAQGQVHKLNRPAPIKTNIAASVPGTKTPTRSKAPPPAPSTPDAPTPVSPSKARRFHDCSHHHGSKSGYTPKMRDPRQPLHEQKTPKAPPSAGEKQGWKIFANEEEDKAVLIKVGQVASVEVDEPGNDEDPFGSTNTDQINRTTSVTAPDTPTPLEDEDKENKSPSKLPLPVQQELLVAGLKKQLHAIARGDIFAVHIGDMPYLPDLADMPKVCQYILRDFDFTDPAIFAVQGEGQGEEDTLLCRVVAKFLETTQEEEIQTVRKAGKLDIFHKMNEAPDEFVKYFADEITLQGAYLYDLGCKLKDVEEQWLGLRRESYLANQQLLKLQRLHHAAASLAKHSKAIHGSPTRVFTPIRVRSRSNSPQKKSSPLKNVISGDEVV